MCGIAGLAWFSHPPGDPRGTIERMTQVVRHRGPDGEGFHIDAGSPGVALGHRRLSIIDLAGGAQPLPNENEDIWVSFNGEIYNFAELQTELVADGHVFRTDCDTEVIVHLYEKYGDRCFEKLRGMFAIALWDARKRRLVLARDRLGQKPLFYRLDPEKGLVFGSELKVVLEAGGEREMDPRAIDLFLAYQYVPHPNCIFRGVRKLPPAHYAAYEHGDLHVHRYWSPPFDAETTGRTRDEWSNELRETLTEAVRLRMRSDVPLGAFLSGGVDSTIVVGLMQSLASEPVKTFSIGFPVKSFDEREFARMAASHLRTEHHEEIVDPQALEELPRLIHHYDEPFADSSAIPTMAVSRMTRQHVTVALSGDAGDELFAGYRRYQAVKLAAKIDALPGPLRKMITARIWQRIPASVKQKSKRRQLKRFLARLALPPEERYQEWVGIFDRPHRESLYSDDFKAALAAENNDAADPAWDHAPGFLRKAYALCPDRDFVTRTTATDVLTYLPCDILNKVDIASMAFGLEARGPFLDHKVVELAARMPIEFKLRGKNGKAILKDTFAEFLPSAITRRRKMGFGVPLDHWFRNELKELLLDVLLDGTARSRGFFQLERVRHLIEEHTAARFDHSYRLWSLLVFELWQRAWRDGTATPSLQPGLSTSSRPAGVVP